MLHAITLVLVPATVAVMVIIIRLIRRSRCGGALPSQMHLWLLFLCDEPRRSARCVVVTLGAATAIAIRVILSMVEYLVMPFPEVGADVVGWTGLIRAVIRSGLSIARFSTNR